ncbi:acyl-ACP--UDP-N-acetylglucosamine O-acyltransferase [Halochromatium glycolicum]|uniref:Acyl-[acyl-carrier-protein]--UDP-N-acetylglucosamine O-acyltransferase n=1 Tax=Halochromatium glycolicum TaxID=85075 RepID=A0AAJ0U281_9GAMM|nr:acyl-ACP--UDP-N-acetylglucosamine O-acyltransferase [Halochromatium glycolicum]MBK1703847.1 acyl-[acyl-carrier-protein]--UDP-N-acetylglucosamine O-acyltransferase [Halochromatium glycolicum]
MIHPTAVVDPSAQLDDDVEVGPYAIIGADVRIGHGTWIGPHALVRGPSVLGCDNRIFQFASVGEEPQDKKYGGEPTRLIVGDRNVVRESATIHRGTLQGGGETCIGNDNLFMAYTHVAHDCIIADHVIMANAASLGGHVVIEDWAILGGFSIVHQFCRIGAHSFSAMGSVIGKDVPPYVTIDGHPAVPRGINSEGLKRRDFSNNEINAIRRAYRLLYMSNLKLDEAMHALQTLAESEPVVARMAAFLSTSARSIVR